MVLAREDSGAAPIVRMDSLEQEKYIQVLFHRYEVSYVASAEVYRESFLTSGSHLLLPIRGTPRSVVRILSRRLPITLRRSVIAHSEAEGSPEPLKPYGGLV